MTTPKGKAGRETDGVRDATPKVKPAREVRSTVARSQSARRELPEAREPREPREREQREVWRDSRRQETAKETAKRRQEPIREPRKETGRTPREPPAQKSPLRQRQEPLPVPTTTDEEERPVERELEGASGETDSFDEEMELLRCQADLVDAVNEIGMTSADDDFVTDPDMDDYDEVLELRLRSGNRPSIRSVVMEEDEEDIPLDDDRDGFEVNSSEVRSRLWAQSLLRLKRSIDEVYSLCEFESDEGLCEQVREILVAASHDFNSLTRQLDEQQEYAVCAGEYPLKSGIAWTTRRPQSHRKTALEVFERTSQSPCQSQSSKETGRARSLDPQKGKGLWPEEEVRSTDGRGRGERSLNYELILPELEPSEDRLHMMVQGALATIQGRLKARLDQHKPSSEELLKRSEDRQRRAQQVRAMQDDQRMTQLRQIDNRILAAREKRQQREEQMQSELLEKMTRARRQYQEHLRIVWQRARKENRKSAEVAYISKEVLKGEREIVRRKQENALLKRSFKREQMRKRLIESAERVARVSENRRRQVETWQKKVWEELEEKERLASQRRNDHIHSKRQKCQEQDTRAESATRKRREIQEQDDRNSKDFIQLRNKHLGSLAFRFDSLPDGDGASEVDQMVAAPTRSLTTSGRKSLDVSRASPPVSPTAAPVSDVLDDAKESPQVDVPKSPVSVRASSTPTVPGPVLHRKGKPRRRSKSPRAQAAKVAPRSPGDGRAPGDVAAGARIESSASTSSSDEAEEPTTDVEHVEQVEESKETEKETGEGAGTAEAARPVQAETPGVLRKGSGVNKGTPRQKPKAEGKDVRGRRSSTNTDTLEEIVEGVPQPIPGTSPTSKGKAPVSAGQEAEDDEATKHLSELRGKLSKTLLSDEEALKMACEFEGSSTAAVNAAHRTRISKRATDLRRVLGLLGTEEAGSGLQSIDPERADAVLADFCKVLTQSQHEADYVLVLELGCVGTVMDTCSRIQDSIVQSGEKGAAAWRQLSSVMLSALKWLGLLSKQKSARVFMLLTNRVVVLADVAVGCLDAHFDAAVPLPETQSISLLCLPQVLHVLSHHVKQALPDAVAGLRLTLVSYLLVCGLADKLKDLFKRVEIRSMRLFDGASPVPMLLLRAMCFLATLVSAYRPLELGTDDGSHALVLQMLRRTEIFGIVTVLVSILLSEGRRDKPAQIAKLPQTVLSLAVQAMRILNSVARIDLQVLQETLVARELYHLLVCLLDYCTSKLQTGKSGPQDESDLLHETVVFLGFYCLNKEDNQGIMCYGEGQTLLTKITSLPLYYFMDERGRLVLFPTILASCFKSKRNLEMLRNEMDVSLLSRFLESALAQDERQQETGTQALGGRFPSLLWQEALLFFSDESTSET